MMLFLAEPKDRAAIYALRYRSYRSSDAIDSNASGSFSDEYDASPNAFTFGIRKDDVIIGSIRLLISECGGRDLTAYQAFPHAIERDFKSTDRVVEANRFVVDPAYRAIVAALDHQLLLFRALVAVAMVFDADYYIGAARRNHIRFYEHVVFMSQIAGYQTYPGLRVEMTLLSGHFRTNYEKVCARWGDRLRIASNEALLWRSRLRTSTCTKA